MEPITLAAAAVGILAPFLGKIAEGGLARAGETLGDTVTEGLGNLHQAIRRRLGRDTYAQGILTGAEEQPDDPRRLAALEGVIAEAIERDPEFAASIGALLEEARAAGAQTIQVNDSGAVAGGNITITGTNVAARDLYLGGSRPTE